MGEFASYRLSDFILFSQSTYFRLFELYNQAIWPLHLLVIAFSVLIIYAIWGKKSWSGRMIAAVLVVSWSWIAVAFLYRYYYQIHVVANWYACGFIIQAVLITWFGVIKNQFNALAGESITTNTARVLLMLALIVYPFIAVLSGRNWMQSEMALLAPDPTVVVTFAILILYRSAKVLYVVPLMWALISVTTLIVM